MSIKSAPTTETCLAIIAIIFAEESRLPGKESMKITILTENVVGYNGAKVCLAEWGFSAFVEVRGLNILFDTGHTDVYKKNAKHLDVNLDAVDFVVLSHHHWDHTGGLRFHDFKDKKKLIAHPETVGKLPKEEAAKIRNEFEIIYSTKPYKFADGMYFLGEIPRKNDFEEGKYKDDDMLDDTAIAIKTAKGAVLITGCSHAGICNICEYAKEVTGEDLYAVIGGFHLFDDNKEVVDRTIEYFKQEKVEHLMPMHCVDHPTQAKFYLNFGSKKYSVGDVIELDA